MGSIIKRKPYLHICVLNLILQYLAIVETNSVSRPHNETQKAYLNKVLKNTALQKPMHNSSVKDSSNTDYNGSLSSKNGMKNLWHQSKEIITGPNSINELKPASGLIRQRDNLNLVRKRSISDSLERLSTNDDDNLEFSKRMREFVGKRSYVPADIQQDIDQQFDSDTVMVDDNLSDDNTDSDSKINPMYPYTLKTNPFSTVLNVLPPSPNSVTPLSISLEDFSLDCEENNCDYSGTNKRMREFVGKRSDFKDPMNEFEGQDLNYDKRMREFVGKRSDYDKRMREFVGKRMREFIGKRSDYDKRMREFVGKRSNYDKRMREFVEKRMREFVGKRSDYDKRMREFVGKRSDYNKRMREFVGKRSDYDKRMREFVGKRMREFVG